MHLEDDFLVPKLAYFPFCQVHKEEFLNSIYSSLVEPSYAILSSRAKKKKSQSILIVYFTQTELWKIHWNKLLVQNDWSGSRWQQSLRGKWVEAYVGGEQRLLLIATFQVYCHGLLLSLLISKLVLPPKEKALIYSWQLLGYP